MSQKEGLNHLVEQARQRGFRQNIDQKATIIPIFSFINQLISSLRGYLNSKEYNCWSAYFLEQYIYERSLTNMIKSWEKLKDTSLQCYLLETLLTVKNRNKLRLYLKTRKYIIQTATENAMLDEVLLDLQDAISIIHKIFSSEEIKKALVQGIKNIFMAFKISQAKLYSSVLIEYLLAVYDSIIRIESSQATITGQFSSTNNHSMYKSSNQNYQELFSSISNFHSTIHNENGLYKKCNFGHSHVSQKKYQIIQKKFLPLKETSQYVSSPNSNKFTSEKKYHRAEGDREKSLFYDFISHKTQIQDEIPQEVNDIKIGINSVQRANQETSFQKQEKFYRKLYDRMEPSHDKSFESKLSESKERKSFSPQPVTQPISKFIKKQPEIQGIKTESTKNFSLGWFSNKLYETQNEEGQQTRQSFLQKSKAKLIKKAQQKRRQSTQRYEIENHLMNGSSHIKKGSQLSRYEAESDKSEQFEKMVTKNQEFKYKILKKSHIQKVSNSQQDYLSRQKRNSICRIFVDIDQENDMNSVKVKLNSQDENVIQFTSNFGTGDSKKQTLIDVKKTSYSPEKDISSDTLKIMKKRNQRILSSFSNGYQSRESYRNESSFEDDQLAYSFKKVPSERVQNSPQIIEKPQIIHKSIGEKKIAHSSKYSNEQFEDFTEENEGIFIEPQNNKSSYQMGKMKSLLRIMDDYRQNAAGHEIEDSQIEISESFCKKSRFYLGEGEDEYKDNELCQI